MRDRGGGKVGSWALGVRPEMVARHGWWRCLGGRPSGDGDEGQAVDHTVGLLPLVTGWVVSTIHHKPLVASPDALLLGGLNPGWSGASWCPQGLYCADSHSVDPGLRLRAAA